MTPFVTTPSYFCRKTEITMNKTHIIKHNCICTEDYKLTEGNEYILKEGPRKYRVVVKKVIENNPGMWRVFDLPEQALSEIEEKKKKKQIIGRSSNYLYTLAYSSRYYDIYMFCSISFFISSISFYCQHFSFLALPQKERKNARQKSAYHPTIQPFPRDFAWPARRLSYS